MKRPDITQMNIQPVGLWPQVLFKDHWDGDPLPILNRCRSSVKDVHVNATLEKGNAVSTVTTEDQPHDWQECEEFVKWISERVDLLWTAWNFRNCKRWITKSWTNIHTRGGNTMEHSHGDLAIVIAWYVSLPPSGGFIEFRNPLEYHWAGYPVENGDKGLWTSVPCKTNDVLIFPGWLKHRVQPSNTDEERWVVTMNITHHDMYMLEDFR